MFSGSDSNSYQKPRVQFVGAEPRCQSDWGPHPIATPVVAHISASEEEQAISELFVILAVLCNAARASGVFHIINEAARYS